MPDQKSSDEIDLFDLLRNIAAAIRANFKLIIAVFVLGIALGTAFYFLSRKVFESKMIVSSNILTDSYAKLLFQNATKHIVQGNSSVLANQLHIPEQAAREVVSLKIANLTETESGIPKEYDRFVITAEVLNQEILPELQLGLVGYLENNEFAKVRVDQNRNFLKQMLVSTEKEIKDLEEFKQKIVTGDFFQTNKGNVMFDPTTVNSKILELTEKKINYQNKLELSSSVEVIDGFGKFSKPIKPRLSISVLSGGFAGLFIVTILILIKVMRKIVSGGHAK